MKMPVPVLKSKTAIISAVALLAALLVGFFFWLQWDDAITRFWYLVTDQNQLKQHLSNYGRAAPLMFVLLQILQVILAPVPGEISGFIGGYLFGTLWGFLYSSLGLAVGSWINLGVGRLLGDRFIRNWIPPHLLERFDAQLRHRGLMIVLLLFVFPGFPKDYLCLFLGITQLPIRLLVIISAFGRMPGTLMLSLQGAALFDRMYGALALIILISFALLLLANRYKERLLKWADRLNER